MPVLKSEGGVDEDGEGGGGIERWREEEEVVGLSGGVDSLEL